MTAARRGTFLVTCGSCGHAGEPDVFLLLDAEITEESAENGDAVASAMLRCPRCTNHVEFDEEDLEA